MIIRAAAAALLFVTTTSIARADGSDAALALSLFQEGQRLVAEGKLPAACAKFAASLKLEAKLGTLLNLADCYEKNGQTASAWARFTEAEVMARRAGQPDREEFAREHAAALASRLSKLT
jgi:tetratricopeptide (TPR) repeat protein